MYQDLWADQLLSSRQSVQTFQGRYSLWHAGSALVQTYRVNATIIFQVDLDASTLFSHPPLSYYVVQIRNSLVHNLTMHNLASTFLLMTSLSSLRPACVIVSNKRYMVERGGIEYNVFEHAATHSMIEFIYNSGVCETTPGVHQVSGYLSVGEDVNMFFW